MTLTFCGYNTNLTGKLFSNTIVCYLKTYSVYHLFTFIYTYKKTFKHQMRFQQVVEINCKVKNK